MRENLGWCNLIDPSHLHRSKVGLLMQGTIYGVTAVPGQRKEICVTRKGVCVGMGTWKAKCPIFKAIVAGFRGKVA